MRQVPVHYLIIGNGRLARHMAFYLDHLGLAYDTFARKTHDFSTLPHLVSKATHILILISDDAIDAFIEAYLLPSDKTLIHFSGSLKSQYAQGAHPLMTFSHTLYTPEIYRNLWFVFEDNNKPFNDILPGIPNAHTAIPKEAKALYHSLCVLSGNFTCLLWQKFFNTLQQKWQIPEQAGHAYFKLIMENILNNPNTALTGPLVRNDQKTIDNNLQALNDDPFQAVYQAFVNAYRQQENT